MRTVDGKIGTFIRYSSRKDDSLYKSPANCFVKFIHRKSNLQCFRDYIVKHSKNIIDLIEVGDYVNGYKVIGVTLDPAPSGKCVDIDCDKPSYESYLFEEQIYSIVTHEQYASMEYKVED